MKRISGLIAYAIVAATCLFMTAPAQPASASQVAGTAAIATGGGHSCVIDTTGAAWCWGYNVHGQLGDGTTTNQDIPVAVTGGHTFTQIAAGTEVTCAIDGSGAAWCWGQDNAGEIGIGVTSGTGYTSPQAANGGHTFTSITAGEEFVCAIDTSRAAWCWGTNYQGKLGDNSGSDHSSPVAVAGGQLFTSLSATYEHICGVTTTNAAYCWGGNGSGQIGDGSTTDRATPTLVGGSQLFTQVAAGEDHTCGITTARDAYCWGYGGQGQLGDGGYHGSVPSPSLVAGSLQYVSIASGRKASCGILTNGLGYCWGNDANGMLGAGNPGGALSPIAMSNGNHWLKIALSEGEFGCGTTNGGGVQCWGSNLAGSLGEGTMSYDHGVPTPTYLFVVTSSQTVAATVDPSFLFSVAGRSSVCNGQSATNFQTSATSTAISLGHVTSANVGGGAQDLTVNTNAANGFTVYIRTSGTTPNSLRSGSNSIADVSGTNASPGAAPVAGTAGFGYTSSDASTVFTSNTFAKLTNTNANVLIGTAGTSAKTACIGYESAVATTTPAGSYSAVVIYVAVPAF